MKKIIWLAPALLFLTMFAASALHAGYRTDPWGSKTWTGPGRPPHWSAEITPSQVKPDHPIAPRKSVGPDQRFWQPHQSHRSGGFWKDRHNRWHYHKHRRSGYIYNKEPQVKKVIVEREKRVPVYSQVEQKPARLQCGGSTVTRNDPKTGDLIIEYVTGARDC